MEMRARSTALTTTEVVVPARLLLRALVVAVAALNVANAVSIVMGADTPRSRYFLLALEGNPSTWLSAALLAGAGVLAYLAAHGRADHRTWCTVAAIFALLSLDEVGTFHEWLGAVPAVPGIGTRGWAGAGLLLALVVAFKLGRWVLELDGALRVAFVAGGAVFLAGAVGVEVLAGEWEAAHGRDGGFWVLSTVEENLELAGVLVVLRGLLDHLAGRPAPLSLRVTG